MSGGCVALLALNALGLAVGYLFGWLDGQVEAAREVLDFLGG